MKVFSLVNMMLISYGINCPIIILINNHSLSLQTQIPPHVYLIIISSFKCSQAAHWHITATWIKLCYPLFIIDTLKRRIQGDNQLLQLKLMHIIAKSQHELRLQRSSMRVLLTAKEWAKHLLKKEPFSISFSWIWQMRFIL